MKCDVQVTASFTERHTFNVAVSELMILSNTLRDGRSLSGSPAYHSALETLCLLLAPMAPHVTAQLWEGKWASNGICLIVSVSVCV